MPGLLGICFSCATSRNSNRFSTTLESPPQDPHASAAYICSLHLQLMQRRHEPGPACWLPAPPATALLHQCLLAPRSALRLARKASKRVHGFPCVLLPLPGPSTSLGNLEQLLDAQHTPTPAGGARRGACTRHACGGGGGAGRAAAAAAAAARHFHLWRQRWHGWQVRWPEHGHFHLHFYMQHLLNPFCAHTHESACTHTHTHKPTHTHTHIYTHTHMPAGQRAAAAARAMCGARMWCSAQQALRCSTLPLRLRRWNSARQGACVWCGGGVLGCGVFGRCGICRCTSFFVCEGVVSNLCAWGLHAGPRQPHKHCCRGREQSVWHPSLCSGRAGRWMEHAVTS